MSLAGLHYSFAAKHPNFGQYLSDCYNAGSPVPVIFSVMQNVAADVLKYSPTTVTVFRYQSSKGMGPDDWTLGQGDPIVAGQKWLNQAAAIFALNSSHTYYSATNELNPKDEAAHHWASAYWLSQMQRADELGYKIVWGNFSTGEPDYGYWLLYAPCIKYAVQHGHVLGLHEYGLDNGSMRNAAVVREGNTVLRYQKVYDLFKQNNWGWPKLIISECAPGSYLQSSNDLADVEWYDRQLTLDRFAGLPIIGAAFYQWGGDEAAYFAPLASRFFEYIRTHPNRDQSSVNFNGTINHQYVSELAVYITERGGWVNFG